MRINPAIMVLLAAASTLGSMSASSSGDVACVGYVVSVNAPLENYQLTRDGKNAMGLGQPVQANDELLVRCGTEGNNTSVTLQCADGKHHLKCRRQPYKVKDEDHGERLIETRLLSNLWRSFRDQLDQLDFLHDKRYRMEDAKIRGHHRPASSKRRLPLFMPLVGRCGGRLAAGTDDLYLAWRGGSPPYALTLRAQDGSHLLASEVDLPGTSAHLKRLKLSPGHYELIIKDASGKVMQRSVEAVAPGSLPTPPNQSPRGTLSEPLRQLRDTAYGIWLSEQDEGEWALEAYQQVAGIADHFYPAELVRLKLAGEL